MDTAKRLLVGDVIHEDEAHGTPVVGSGDCAVALLSSCILHINKKITVPRYHVVNPEASIYVSSSVPSHITENRQKWIFFQILDIIISEKLTHKVIGILISKGFIFGGNTVRGGRVSI